MTWTPLPQVPPDDKFVLVTLEEDGTHWVEPGWYKENRFGDIHRNRFEENIVAWMLFPEPYKTDGIL